MSTVFKIKYIISLVGAIIVLDQGSKYLAIQLLEGKGVISLLGDTLRFLLAENRGGFLSFGASLPDGARKVIFLVLSSVFLGGFLFFTIVDKNLSKPILLASVMIIGGGIGNLIDRLFRDGVVIDFVNIGIGSLRTGIFNVADMAVLFGCIFLFISLVRGRHE